MRAPVFAFAAILFLFCALLWFFWFQPINSHSDFIPSMPGYAISSSASPQNFDIREDEKNYHLTYEWEDFEGDPFRLSFSLSKEQINQAEKEFGYYPADLRKHLDDNLEKLKEKMVNDLRAFTQEMIRKSKYSDYIFIDKVTEKSFNLKLSVPPPLHKKVKRAYDKIKADLAKEQTKYLKEIEKEQEKERGRFLGERGIRAFNGEIGIDHGFCVLKNKNRVRHIFEILRQEHEDLSLHQFLGLLLSFIQEIRYYIPPVSERGKIILAFWVPPRVLADNLGDCDSKGVTFASLWTHFRKYPLLLITVPKHFFIGLAIPSFGEEGLVMNGLRYTLCEVTGPEKMPPGMIGRYSQICLQNGQFVYELIN